MKLRIQLSAIVLSIVGLFGACSEDDFQETIGLCPQVIATSPTNGETSVSLNKVITVTFNEEMNPATINATSFTIVNGTTSIPGIISYSGNTASFTPTGTLIANKTYIGKVTTAVKD